MEAKFSTKPNLIPSQLPLPESEIKKNKLPLEIRNGGANKYTIDKAPSENSKILNKPLVKSRQSLNSTQIIPPNEMPQKSVADLIEEKNLEKTQEKIALIKNNSVFKNDNNGELTGTEIEYQKKVKGTLKKVVSLLEQLLD